MKILYVADLHYSLRQFDWLLANASGNHDVDARNGAGEWFARWLLKARGDGLFVDGDEVSLPEATVTLCPWWDGPVSRAELENLLKHAALRVAGKWIWIHHAPPSPSSVSWTGTKFEGDKYLVEWIHRFGPDLVLSGHIHNAPFYAEGSWIDRIGKTWIFNPGRQIGPQPTSIIFDLDAMTAHWFSLEGDCLGSLR